MQFFPTSFHVPSVSAANNNNNNKTIRATQTNISHYALQQCHKLAANCHTDSCLIALLSDLHSTNLTLIHSNGLTVQLTNSCVDSN
jgi:hypothetical protein